MCVVLQSSNLFLLLFKIYMTLLNTFIWCYPIIHLYSEWSNEAINILSHYLEAVGAWMWKNNLRHNPEKTKQVWVLEASKSWGNEICISVWSCTLQIELVYKMEVPLDLWHLVQEQVVVMAKIALAQLLSAYQFCSFFDLDVLFIVTHVLVTSSLD